MKNLIILSFLLSAVHVSAQTTTTEQGTNQVLLDNAAKAREYLEAGSNSKPKVIKILGDKGSSTSRDAGDLTDQEKQLSENFVDQAGANKIIKEKCAGEMEQICAGMEGDHKVMGMSPGLIKAAGQAYAMFSAMSGDFLTMAAGSGSWFQGRSADQLKAAESGADKVTTKVVDPKTGAETTTTTTQKQPTDYCKYIPAASEMIAKFSQQSTVKDLNNGAETSQKEQLLKAAKSHDGRAEQGQYQTIGWYGGAACYAVNMASGNFATDTSSIIKLTAATFLGVVYQKEVEANKDYAQKTRDIANALPGKGKCNPITENECYCATPEYANDPTYCKAQIDKRNAASGFTRVACTDDKLKIDPACNCQKTNSCFDKFLEVQGGASLELGAGYSNSPFRSVAALARGRLEGGNLGTSAYAGTSAIAKKALNEALSRVPGNNKPLTLAQKEIADALISKGIPAGAARIMASNPAPQSAVNSVMAKTSGLGYSYQPSSSFARSNVVDFSGGFGLGTSGKKADKKTGMEELLGKMGANKGAVSNAKVLEFAQKAQAQASQITKSDRPIFEIISLRYQTSGRRLLQIDASN